MEVETNISEGDFSRVVDELEWISRGRQVRRRTSQVRLRRTVSTDSLRYVNATTGTITNTVWVNVQSPLPMEVLVEEGNVESVLDEVISSTDSDPYRLDSSLPLVDIEVYSRIYEHWKRNYYLIIKAFSPILNSCFPERWQVKFQSSGEKLEFTMLYPELLVERNEYVKHSVKQLYVRFWIKYTGSLITVVSGTRGYLTSIELASDYTHSHLPSDSKNNFNPFCLGESILKDLMAMIGSKEFIQGDSLREDAEIEFEAFLNQLESFLSHEAVNGSPYRYIEKIGFGPIPSISSVQVEQSTIRFFSRSDLYTLQMSLGFSENSTPHVRINEISESLERAFLESASVLCHKDQAGKEFGEPVESTATSNPSFITFLFRGQIVTQTIVPCPPITTTLKKYCPSSIKNSIINTINNEIQRAEKDRPIKEVYRRGREEDSRYLTKRVSANITDSRKGKAKDNSTRQFEDLVNIVQNQPH